MTPAARRRVHELVDELLDVLEAGDVIGRDLKPGNVLKKPRRMQRQAPPRPRGPVSVEAVERAKQNLSRRGFMVTERRK